MAHKASDISQLAFYRKLAALGEMVVTLADSGNEGETAQVWVEREERTSSD